MKKTIVLSMAMLAGCGHTFTNGHATPSGTISSTTDITLGVTDSKSVATQESDWNRCMARQAGNPSAAQECQTWMEAFRPGHMPKYYYPYGAMPYGTYGNPYYQPTWVTPSMMGRY